MGRRSAAHTGTDVTPRAEVTDPDQLLEQTLDEEKQTDARLTQLAEQSVNQKAQAAGQ